MDEGNTDDQIIRIANGNGNDGGPSKENLGLPSDNLSPLELYLLKGRADFGIENRERVILDDDTLGNVLENNFTAALTPIALQVSPNTDINALNQMRAELQKKRDIYLTEHYRAFELNAVYRQFMEEGGQIELVPSPVTHDDHQVHVLNISFMVGDKVVRDPMSYFQKFSLKPELKPYLTFMRKEDHQEQSNGEKPFVSLRIDRPQSTAVDNTQIH